MAQGRGRGEGGSEENTRREGGGGRRVVLMYCMCYRTACIVGTVLYVPTYVHTYSTVQCRVRSSQYLDGMPCILLYAVYLTMCRISQQMPYILLHAVYLTICIIPYYMQYTTRSIPYYPQYTGHIKMFSTVHSTVDAKRVNRDASVRGQGSQPRPFHVK